MDTEFYDYKFFIIGETHFFQEITSHQQLELIQKLSNKGVKKINLYIELPPSSVFLLEKYYKTKDTTWLGIHKFSALKYNFKNLIDGLSKYKNIHFELIPIDFPDKNTFEDENIFKNYYYKHNILENYNILMNLGLLPYFMAGSYKKSIKILEKINISKFEELEKVAIDSPYSSLFYEEIRLSKQYGFVRPVTTLFGENYINREKYMAKVIDEYCKKDDSSVHIITVGRAHLIPITGNIIPEIIKYSTVLDTFNTAKIIILYPPDDIFGEDMIIYGKEQYPQQKPLQSLIDRRIFDMILLPPGETVGEKK